MEAEIFLGDAGSGRPRFKNQSRGPAPSKLCRKQAEARQNMNFHYIAIAIYLALGLFEYNTIGGVGAHLDGEKKPPLWRRLLVIVLWPLAMIGAIEG
ncbi:MAG: hypothetical protein ACRD4Y_01265 [Candidatus Acidiferrales bacterium]